MTPMRRLLSVLTVAAALFHLAACDKQQNPDFDFGVIDLAGGGTPPDLSRSSVGMPTCTPPGTVTCPSGTFFAASPSQSGCFTNGTTVPNSITPPFDSPAGTCSSVGDKVIACPGSPNCSFCIKIAAAVPAGCAVQ